MMRMPNPQIVNVLVSYTVVFMMIYAFYFLQVTYGLLEAFSFVRWPDALEDIAKYSEVLQLNFLQMAPLHCLIRGIKVRDHHKTIGGVVQVSRPLLAPEKKMEKF